MVCPYVAIDIYHTFFLQSLYEPLVVHVYIPWEGLSMSVPFSTELFSCNVVRSFLLYIMIHVDDVLNGRKSNMELDSLLFVLANCVLSVNTSSSFIFSVSL